MTIKNNESYKVIKYDLKDNSESNYGIMNGSDVKLVIGTAKYDEDYGMWFTPKANIGYSIEKA